MLRPPSAPSPTARHGAWTVRAGLAALLLVIATLAVTSAVMDSATDDEPMHLAAGYLKLTAGEYGFFREQPPLIDALCALPLAAGGARFPADWRGTPNEWDVGHRFLYGSGNDADALLLRARLPVIGLLLLLCLLVYAWIRHATGNRLAALGGAALAGFCPNLLAHGRLATTDLGVTFFVALASFLFLRFLAEPSAARAARAGLALAAALLSKVSALILLLYFPLLLALFVALEGWPSAARRRAYLVSGALLLAVALLGIEAFYLLTLRQPYLEAAHPALAGRPLGRLAVPLIEYLRNVATVFQWVSGPYNKPQFLLGSFSFTGWWYYYPVAFLLKTTLPALGLLAGAILAFGTWLRRAAAPAGEPVRTARLHAAAALLFVVLFVGAACTSRLDIGLRYILPVYPFVYVFTGVALALAWPAPGRARSAALAALALAGLWHAGSSAAAYPSYISYFNALIGSPRNADRVLIDSNLDWGQDLKRLARWTREQQIPRIHLLYFGGGNPGRELGPVAIPYPWTWEPGYYAVSRHLYRMSTFSPKALGSDLPSAFASARYVTTIGGSILVFRIE